MSCRFSKLALLVAGMALFHVPAQELPADSPSLTTSERLKAPGWWPTKGDAGRSSYAGSETCAECHRTVAALQQATPMFHAGVPVADSTMKDEPLKFQEAGLDYSISRSPKGVIFTVSDGSNSNSAPVVWAFGAGAIGETYILKKGNVYLEGRLSYFTRLSGLDITIGHSANSPAGVDTALGHTMDDTAARRCFGCHTTEAVVSGIFQAEKALPGIQCEACHGPGAAHVTAMKSKQFNLASVTITNSAHLAPSDSVDFCGACHRTWADVVMEAPAGIGVTKVRFQPYLLEDSRCWGKNGDPRITCIACHDPHKPLVRESSAYDAKCLACHAAAKATRAACPVGTSNCASCHMPKYELPQTHATFTDHLIRVVR